MSVILRLPQFLRTSTCLSSSRILPNIKYSFSYSTAAHLTWFNPRILQPATSQQKEKKYMKKDRVPSNHQLIYKAPMESYVAWAMHMSTVTASLMSGVALYQYANNQPLLDPVGSALIMHIDDIYYFAFGFLAINAVLRFVVSKFPLRIYKDNGKYLAVYHSQLPGGMSQHSFNKGDVKEVSYILSPWNGATYKLGTKTSLILEEYFKTPSEFHQMFTTKEE